MDTFMRLCYGISSNVYYLVLVHPGCHRYIHENRFLHDQTSGILLCITLLWHAHDVFLALARSWRHPWEDAVKKKKKKKIIIVNMKWRDSMVLYYTFYSWCSASWLLHVHTDPVLTGGVLNLNWTFRRRTASLLVLAPAVLLLSPSRVGIHPRPHQHSMWKDIRTLGYNLLSLEAGTRTSLLPQIEKRITNWLNITSYRLSDRQHQHHGTQIQKYSSLS